MTDVRSMEIADLESVYRLWCDKVVEAVGAPISFDRWGPGIAVPVGDAVPPDLFAPEPSRGVRAHLAKTLDTATTSAFVADRDGDVDGFLTARVESHPTMPGIVGVVEQIYVSADRRRHGIGTALVEAALEWMRACAATVFRTELELDDEACRLFWQSVGWDSELRLMSLYD